MQVIQGGSSRDPDMVKNFLFKAGGSWRIGNIDHYLPSRF
jgi:hypothetical protein